MRVTPEGKVKILDFGLAKAFEDETPVTDISQSPTLTEEMTRAGVILGTAAYMSPEQAKGKPVDKRADVFAFGAVLYELLTGKRAFEGETITETIAKVLESEPKWEVLPQNTPWAIRNLLRRCLAKDPRDRLDGIANVRIEIKMALSEPTTVSPTGQTMAKQPAPLRRTITLGLVALAGVVVGVVIWSLISSSPPPQQPLNRFAITPPLNAPLADFPGPDVVISPDGRRIVYVAVVDGVRQLYVRELDELISRPVSGTEGMSFTPFFLSDGESIAFQAEGKLKKASLLGGPSMTLCEATSVLGGSWFEGTIVFAGITQKGSGLHRVSAAGGEPESLAIVDSEEGERQYRGVKILPQGKTVLSTLHRGDGSSEIVALSLETGERKIVLEGGREPHYAPTGHLVYEATRTGILMAVGFDIVRVEVTGKPSPILEGVRQDDCCTVDYSLSRDGTLVYAPTGAGMRGSLVWVDRDGREGELLTETPRIHRIPRLSPDGQSLAVEIREQNKEDIWVYEVNRRRRIRLTFEGSSTTPVWTRDGNRVTFTSGLSQDVYWKKADGSGEIELLWESVNNLYPTSWSPDGQTLAFQEVFVALRDIWMLRSEGDASPFLATSFDEDSPMFSPDGHWVAYVSDESGRDEVYVQPYPDGGRIVAISNEGGREPMWSPDGRELFYRQGGQMMVVRVETKPTFSAEEPRLLFEGTYLQDGNITNYDVSPDGKRFVMIRPDEESTLAQINVIQNWTEELKRLVPTP